MICWDPDIFGSGETVLEAHCLRSHPSRRQVERSPPRSVVAAPPPLLMLGVAPRVVAGRAALLLRSQPAAARLGSLSRSIHRADAPCTAIRQLSMMATRRPTAAAWRLPRVRATSTKAEVGGGGGSSRREELAEKSKAHVGRLKDLWNKYGIVAIGTYLSMYGAVLGSIYVAIDQGWVKTKKTSKGSAAAESDEFNLVTTTNRFVTMAENLGVAQYLELEHVNAKTGTFLLAWIATKFTEPVRLALTIAITPRIARLLGRAPKLPPKIK